MEAVNERSNLVDEASSPSMGTAPVRYDDYDNNMMIMVMMTMPFLFLVHLCTFYHHLFIHPMGTGTGKSIWRSTLESIGKKQFVGSTS